MKGPPAKINVADPQPSRGPRYRYPQEAKWLIAEMLQDMEDRQIIEKSTSAWLSPIVLVNKPDGSKRMCVDYRHVNKHVCLFVFFFFFFTVAPVGFLQGPGGLAKPVMAQAALFIVAPAMPGSCFPPELIPDSLDGFF